MNRKKLLFVLCLSIVLVFVAVANSEELAKKQVLKYASDNRSISSLDPICKGNNGTFPIQNMIFESLVRYEPGCTDIEKIQPALAESWSVSKDGRIWTFNLRKGVKWHKGYGEFTSTDVKYSIERTLNSEKSQFRARFANIDSINVSNPYKVIFNLKDIDAFFLFKLANKFAGWLSCKAAVEDMGEEEYGLLPIGTGPFEIVENIAKEKIVLKRNDEYWRGKPILERVEYYLMPDNTSRTMALINGEIDVIRGVVSPEWHDTVISNGMKIGYGLPGQLILNFNMTKKPFDDIRIRKAFAYAIGRKAVLDFYGKTAIPQWTAVPSFVFSSLKESEIPEEYRYEKNIEKAKELLAEAGYPDGFEVETVITEHADYLIPVQIWQEELKDVGIKLKIIVVDHPSFHQKIRTDQFPLVVYGGVRDPIADVWLYQWYSSKTIVGTPTGVTNFSHYGQVDANGDGLVDSIDNFIDEAKRTLDTAKQKELWQEAQYQLLRDLPVFPSHCVRIMFAWQPYVNPGYDLNGSVVDAFEIWENTCIMKH